METYSGRIVFEGYAIEDIAIYDDTQNFANLVFTQDDKEFANFTVARNKAIKIYDELYNNALHRLGEEEATLFKTYKLMAEDLDFEDLVRFYISEKFVASQAVIKASEQLSETFAALDDEYMRARAADVKEVGKNISDILVGKDKMTELYKPSILICNDLSASVLMRFDRKMLKGLVLLRGNVNSHVSIFARTLEIPTICAVDNPFPLSPSLRDEVAIVDAIKGKLILKPSKDDLKRYKEIKKEYEKELIELKSYKGKPTVTKDGVKLKIYANIASALELENVIANDAEGIGLFRSEFIYLSSKSFPKEEFQFNYYREVIEEMHGKEVIIRTLDIGADKQAEYFNIPKEENPALGYRSIRICIDRPEIFKTQLRALYRASAYGNLSIMVPMITNVDEVKFIRKMAKEVQDELTKEKIKFNKKVKIGIMIETPAAAMISDDLAKYVDFFSIGTNDLSQYTLACDRLNPLLNKTFISRHKAILRLIKLTVENAHKNGIICGICGELGRDPLMLPFLCAIHIDEISCSSAYILKVRKNIKSIDTRKYNLKVI